MTFDTVIRDLEAARRNAEGVVRIERGRWQDAQYERFLHEYHQTMTAETRRLLETLREQSRRTAAMLRSLEASR